MGLDAYATFAFVGNLVKINTKLSDFDHTGQIETEAVFSVPDVLTLSVCVCVCSDEFKGHSLLQAAREADMAKAKKTLALEIINFKHPHTHETALVRETHARFNYTRRFSTLVQRC